MDGVTTAAEVEADAAVGTDVVVWTDGAVVVEWSDGAVVVVWTDVAVVVVWTDGAVVVVGDDGATVVDGPTVVRTDEPAVDVDAEAVEAAGMRTVDESRMDVEQ